MRSMRYHIAVDVVVNMNSSDQGSFRISQPSDPSGSQKATKGPGSGVGDPFPDFLFCSSFCFALCLFPVLGLPLAGVGGRLRPLS